MARSGRGTGCYGPKTRIFHAFWALAGPRGVPVELPFGAKAVQLVLFTSAETEPPRPTFASLWRVVAAIAALFQVPWRRKTGVGKAIFSIGCCCLAYQWRRTRYFAYKIMTGTCFMTDLAP